MPSAYVYTCDALVPGLHLAYSSKTGALLEFDEHEWSHARAILLAEDGAQSVSAAGPVLERLIANGLLVERDINEVAQVRLARQANKEAGDRWLSMTIAPTMQCNFRCIYCFEEHRAEFMSMETAQAVVAYVEQQLDAHSHEGVGVCWFGGEPLMGARVIEYVQGEINTLCSQRGIGATRSIITNGFLLSGNMIERLKALGSWEMVQITIDGTPLVHDGRRPLINGRGTYERVVQNASRARASGLPVTIRMNVDAENSSGDHLARALRALADAGAGNLIPGVYLGTIVDSTPECSHMHETRLSHKRAAEARLRLARELLRLGFASNTTLPKPTCILCTADSANGVTIAPTGLMFKCWNEIHLDATRAIGCIGDGVQVDPLDARRNAAQWSEYEPLSKSECVDCKALPACMGGCPWEARAIDAAHGNCGTLKFEPELVVQLAHADRSVAKLGQE